MAQAGCIVLGAALLMLLAAGFIRERARQKRLEELTLYVMKLQDDPGIPQWENCGEGKMDILESEIYKLAALYYETTARVGRENAYLSKMLSDISHQIRTPLTSVTIMTDLLKEPQLPEEKRLEFAGRIDQQISRINWLIKNLLTLSQLEADVLKLKKEKVSVRALLEKSAEPFGVLADVREVELEVCLPEEMYVTCDAHWTAEALSNIIKNCMEHSKSGGKVRIEADQNNLATNIWIRDNGEGIAKEELGHIFERFYKGKNASDNSVGIGLALARQIILQQNGTITVKSEPGEGTEFHIKWYTGTSFSK